MYDKLNKLPDDRNELLPIKKAILKHDGYSNFFKYNLTVESALDVTRNNIAKSMNFKIENIFFKQIMPIADKNTMEKESTLELIFLSIFMEISTEL